jgi:hyaluronoglucosaminidase
MAVTAIALTLLVAPAAGAASPFAWRGAIQGQYGPRFSHDERTRLIEFIALHGFNAYVNAPKDDPYQRQAWRTQYPPVRLAEFAAEIQLARGLGVEWIPAISPDVPRHPRALPPGVRSSGQICFSCARDRQALLDKLEPFWDAGARTFMIAFDDFDKALTHSRDRATFGRGPHAYGEANAYLLNRVYADLRNRDASARLLTVAADYHGTADTPYLRAFRGWLGRGIQVLWTGPRIRARDFSPRQARAYGRLVGRAPAVWDNWVNNDGSGRDAGGNPKRVFLGPYRRRPDVAGDVRGFFLNTATEVDLNFLPFATAGDWLTAPWTYSAAASFRRHVAELGGSVSESLRAFAETGYSTELIPRVEAPTFTRLGGRFLHAYGIGGRWRHSRRAIVRELGLVRDARDNLGSDPALGRFADEATPFLESARKRAVAGLDAIDLLVAERPVLELSGSAADGYDGHVAPPSPTLAGDLRSTLAAAEGVMYRDRHAAYGGRTRRYRLHPNAMRAFLARVHRLDSAWRTEATSAARAVTLRLGRRAIRVAADGSFRLSGSDCGGLLTATDSAGGQTSLRLPACS